MPGPGGFEKARLHPTVFHGMDRIETFDEISRSVRLK